MKRKYTLKPGRHQFAPGSHAVHTSDNLNDEEAEWYLERYPHIASLFVEVDNGAGDSNSQPDRPAASVKSKKRSQVK